MTKRQKIQMALLPLIIAAVVGLDQAIKALVVRFLPIGEPTESLLGFRLLHTRNTGAAFSLFRDSPRLLTVATGLVLLACLAYLFLINKKKVFSQNLCLALVCGGGLANLLDRIRLGYVIDYIEPVFINFAVFNFADSVLCCAIGVWAFLQLREALRGRRGHG
jgi:signal peptidase II